jgi:hypothetical protein
MPYDPKKAAEVNKLIQGGMSEDAAFAQAGIPPNDYSYAIGLNGQVGALVVGAPARPGVETLPNVAQATYAVKADAPVSTKTSSTYNTTSTETVSGGGSTSEVAGPKIPTAESRQYAAEGAAKQAEIDQFIKDNPSNLARKRQGLPPLSPEETEARNAKLNTLQDQQSQLYNKKIDAETSTPGTITTVPNTTTTTRTVTTGTTSTNTAVQSPVGADASINQQTETNLGVAVGASNVKSVPANVETNESVSTPPPTEVAESVFDPDGIDARLEAEQAQLREAEGAAIFAPNPVLGSGDEAIDAANEAELAQIREAEGAAIFAPNPVLGSGDEAIDAANEAELAQLREAEGAAIFAPDPLPAATPSGDFAFNANEEAERDNLNAAIKQGTLDKARAQNTIANQRRNPNNGDWRVKLRLAPGADYLYNAPEPGILNPLKGTGIIFPYTPTINTSYKATYSSYDLTHSNYKGYYYQSSSVEPVSLSCPFTAQSTVEAEYLLAVIHFFKSVTKMFYGQDPQRGTPPPLVYLTGLGEFQFNEHPCVVQSFTYDLPVDVDYIRARSPNVNNSNMLNKRQSGNPTGPGTTFGGGILGNVLGGAINRLANAGLPKGGMSKPPAPASFGQNTPTYVPTKMTIAISLLPVQSRKQQSQQFSLRQYANGDLLKGGFW